MERVIRNEKKAREDGGFNAEKKERQNRPDLDLQTVFRQVPFLIGKKKQQR